MTNPLIVALDLEAAEARALVQKLGSSIGFYKVGLELFTAEGPAIVRELTGAGKRVFLDLKMYDIGETVKRATARAAELGVSLLTVHAHPQVIRAARAGAAGSQLQILAVTVLTSFNQADLEDLGVSGRTISEQVELLASKGVEAGADGFVCSPLEVARLRAIAGPGAILVTPGVRSPGADQGDQKRVATPAEALAAGASYLVIGREITRAAEPSAAAERVLSGIGSFKHLNSDRDS
ncbi:MAG: orotidine-5'-phosphate decarboxylase [Bryobacteraceae bacterium]|nr:orotidine-5'-phosphate decarboxylase [Bryobacteraceae bacterium]